MPSRPFDLANLVRGDLVLADVLLSRVEHGHGSRSLLVSELVASLSLQIAASDAVIAPAVDEHVSPGDDMAAALIDQNRRIAESLTLLEAMLDEPSGPASNDSDAAIATIHGIIAGQLADLDDTEHRDSAITRQLRGSVGDDSMVALGHEYTSAKRHAPSRPHPNSSSALIRIVSVIDRVKDASSGRAALAATDGSGLLSPESQAVVNALAELGPKPIELLDPEQARRQPAPIDGVNRVLEARDEDIVPPLVARVDDSTIPTPSGEVAVRIYDARPDAAILKPVVVYVHGGGWVIADIYSSDASARGIALLVDAIVVSVEYRHAPEHPFPAAHDDVLAAVRWLQQHAADIGGDPSRIALVGESAGGNLVAATCLGLLRAGQPLPLAQVLVYPVTSLRDDWASFCEHADAKPLNTAMIGWFMGHLLSGPTAADDRIDLLTAPEADLAQLPPTLIITADRDPLHDQGVAFSQRLKVLGVAAALREYQGVPHEFFGMARVLSDARDAQAAAAALLTSAFVEAR